MKDIKGNNVNPEEILAKMVQNLNKKADIDYVDEANDINQAREQRELTALKKKFNDLLNFLSTVPGIGGSTPSDLRPRGTKQQALACISCDRGGSPPRDDLRGTNGQVYQGEQSAAGQGFPARIAVQGRDRPQSAPGKRHTSPRGEPMGSPRAIPAEGLAPLSAAAQRRGPSTVHMAGSMRDAVGGAGGRAQSVKRPGSAGKARNSPTIKPHAVTPKFS